MGFEDNRLHGKSPLAPLFLRGERLESGYTLLEILVAISILSIVLIPLMEMLPRTLLMSSQLERETKVAFLAQRKVEDVKCRAIYDFSVDYTESAAAFPAPDSSYKYTVSDDQGAEIKEIAVTVWYDEDNDNSVGGDEEQIVLYTKFAKRD